MTKYLDDYKPCLINNNVNLLFQGVAQAIATTNHGYLLIPGGPGASDVYR